MLFSQQYYWDRSEERGKHQSYHAAPPQIHSLLQMIQYLSGTGSMEAGSGVKPPVPRIAPSTFSLYWILQEALEKQTLPE